LFKFSGQVIQLALYSQCYKFIGDDNSSAFLLEKDKQRHRYF